METKTFKETLLELTHARINRDSRERPHKTEEYIQDLRNLMIEAANNGNYEFTALIPSTLNSSFIRERFESEGFRVFNEFPPPKDGVYQHLMRFVWI